MHHINLLHLLPLLALAALCDPGGAVDELTSSLDQLQQSLDAVGLQMEHAISAMDNKVEELRSTVTDLTRHTMLLQFAAEERARSEEDSGVKLVRGNRGGPENYFESSHISRSFNSIHDHANYDRTLGMGEVIAVLNGVQFRTRHNDFKLVMPSTSSTEYHATEPIPFPGVPDAVTSKETVAEQIDEMRLWFKAFKDQNHTVRDYRQYFKPVLIYMEGAWTLDTELEEPFQSDRHQIDASSWFQLQERVRYVSHSGSKSRSENYAYLPTTIMSVNSTTGEANYAQWNYRILGFPLQEDIPLSYLRQMDDLSYRVPIGQSPDYVRMARGARFRLYEETVDTFQTHSLLDRLFYTIPGKDIAPGNLTQNDFGEVLYELGESKSVLKTGFYHHWFQFGEPGAMGTSHAPRGFNDASLWVAQTTQKRIAPLGLTICLKKKVPVKGVLRWKRVCEWRNFRVSYAIPLEIIYMTPLLSWNPYNIALHESLATIRANGRSGGKTAEKAYNGTHSSVYYQTPAEFFSRPTDGSDPADTVKNTVSVLDPDGVVRVTTASGTRIVLQSIEGVGPVRLRYPIAPVAGEGSPVWKELGALKKLVVGLPETNKPPTVVIFFTSTTTRNPPGEHFHEIFISYESYRQMVDNGAELEVTTSHSQGHAHELTIFYNRPRRRFEYKICSGSTHLCRDGHPRKLFLQTVNQFTLIT